MKTSKVNSYVKAESVEMIEKDLNKSCEKIVTLKFAIKGLLGELPSYITDKLIEICGEIAIEQQRVDFLKSIKSGVKN